MVISGKVWQRQPLDGRLVAVLCQLLVFVVRELGYTKPSIRSQHVGPPACWLFLQLLTGKASDTTLSYLVVARPCSEQLRSGHVANRPCPFETVAVGELVRGNRFNISALPGVIRAGLGWWGSTPTKGIGWGTGLAIAADTIVIAAI